jgi:hypothetical protein
MSGFFGGAGPFNSISLDGAAAQTLRKNRDEFMDDLRRQER